MVSISLDDVTTMDSRRFRAIATEYRKLKIYEMMDTMIAVRLAMNADSGGFSHAMSVLERMSTGNESMEQIRNSIIKSNWDDLKEMKFG